MIFACAECLREGPARATVNPRCFLNPTALLDHIREGHLEYAKSATGLKITIQQ